MTILFTHLKMFKMPIIVVRNATITVKTFPLLETYIANHCMQILDVIEIVFLIYDVRKQLKFT